MKKIKKRSSSKWVDGSVRDFLKLSDADMRHLDDHPLARRNWSYAIIEDTPEYILIQDLCVKDHCMSITNAAEGVVNELIPILNGRQLFYIDTMGKIDELLIKDEKFYGFCEGKKYREHLKKNDSLKSTEVKK